ncbi:hypothetical protein LTS07_007752 [Exophiala sideris]|uniref:Uncharacterized protein n=1 Tax=Exophiala sideris TaxID=1016849 RepID=A0ABR0JA93_9EURO|nr:hypothetical protein LTS07_007752 [Exophiala sideris]KAK5032480.1 hypothetical protein LTR13_007303 [Exophiala sideris]KAK5059638.1 hypothetical protein LTR69_006227 [Exophiala sideris]
MIEKLIASKMQVTCSHQLCADVSNNIHIFPDICVKCEENGVIGDFLNQEPSRKLEILRGWKKQNRSDNGSKSDLAPSAQGPPAVATDEENDVEKLEILEVLSVADIASTSKTGSESESLPTTSSPETMASSVTSVGGSPDLKSIKARIRAHKAVQTAEKDT